MVTKDGSDGDDDDDDDDDHSDVLPVHIYIAASAAGGVG